VQAFATGIATTVREDRCSDEQVGQKLDRLTGAVSRNDSETVRQEAFELTQLVRDIMAQRRAREEQQLRDLGHRVQSLREELAELRKQAAIDTLTQLFNRGAFDEEAERTATLGLLIGLQPYLLMVDVDQFKSVNDQSGHAAGDHVLRAVADTLVRNFLRKEDFVARYGGDEFAVIVPSSSPDVALSRAERVRTAVQGLDLSEAGVTGPVTVSIGLATIRPGEAAPAWISRADQALYQAKATGRNRVVIAEDGGEYRVSPASLRPSAAPRRTGCRPAERSLRTER
jgi:diguanylate cyclase